MSTIKQETLESFLDVELCVQDDEPEAHGEGLVACVASEKGADGV